MARLTTIRLYGVLGARFGRVHRLEVQTSAEAVKALCINLDGLESYLLNAKKNGMTFAVFRGRRNIGVQDFQELAGDSDIRIAPVMEGAKKAGMFQTILGAVMVVAGIIVGVATGRCRSHLWCRTYHVGRVNDGWWNLPDAFAPAQRTTGARRS